MAMPMFDGRDLKTLQKCISDLTSLERYLEEQQQGNGGVVLKGDQQQRLKEKMSDKLLEMSRLSYALVSMAGVETSSITNAVEEAVAIMEKEEEDFVNSSLDHWLQMQQPSMKLLTAEFVSQVLKGLMNDKLKSLLFYKWSSKQRGFTHTSTTLNYLLMSYLKAGHVEGALELLTSEHKNVTDASTYQLVVPRLTTGHEMIHMLALMHKSGVVVDLGLCKQALRMFLEDDHQDKCSLLVICSLIDLCEKSGDDNEEAWDLLARAAAQGRLERANKLIHDVSVQSTDQAVCDTKHTSEQKCSSSKYFTKCQQTFIPGFSNPTSAHEEEGWFYLDPEGSTHGPYGLEQLQEWNATGGFPTDLKIWKEGEPAVLMREVLWEHGACAGISSNLIYKPRLQLRSKSAFLLSPSLNPLNPLADEFKPPSRLR